MAKRRFFTLRQVLLLPSVVLPLLLAGIFLLLFRDYSASTAEGAARRVITLWSDSVTGHLNQFLDHSVKISRMVAEDVVAQRLVGPSGGDMSLLEEYFRQRTPRVIRDYPGVTYLGFGSAEGDFVGVRANVGTPPFTLIMRDRRTDLHMVAYDGDRIGRVIADFPDYDARQRPWYQAAMAAGVPIWTPIYTNRDERADLTISAVEPVRSGDGTLIGVTVIDTNLTHQAEFLRRVKGASTGEIAIVDSQRCLVASSRPEPVTGRGDQSCGSSDAPRMPLSASPSPLLQAVSERLDRGRTEGGGFVHLQGKNGADAFAMVTHYQSRGLDWRVVVAMPESEVLGDLHRGTRAVVLMTFVVVMLGAVLGLWLVNHLAGPIRVAARAAQELAKGEWPRPLAETQMVSEAEELVRAFNVMAGRLEQSFGRLRHQICVDSLTGVLTRAGFAEEFDRVADSGGSATLYRVGLDRFRTINDGVGYRTGDVLLAAAAERIAAVAGPRGLIGRFTGDEFVILLCGIDDDAAAAAVGHRLMAAFSAAFTLSGEELLLSVCIGYVRGTLANGCREQWISRAGLAMTEAKRRGAGTLQSFVAELEERAGDAVRLIGDLGRAVEDGTLQVYYQPLCRLSDRALVGCEALVRWRHPRRGWISPAVFIPMAEESPLILSLGLYVMETACRQMREWLDARILPADGDMHVNVSGRQLMQSDFVSELENVLRRTGLAPHNLGVEVTESCLLPQGDTGTDRLAELRGMGVKIAIDDFGTGYSSLAYLHQVPFTCLKLDQSFVRRLVDDETSRSIVGAVTNLSQAFSASVVAEGIETEIQLSLLRSMGCGIGQGFLLGRPLPPDEFARAFAPVSA